MILGHDQDRLRKLKSDMRTWAYVQEKTSPTPHNVIVDKQTFDRWVALLEELIPSEPDQDPNLA